MRGAAATAPDRLAFIQPEMDIAQFQQYSQIVVDLVLAIQVDFDTGIGFGQVYPVIGVEIGPAALDLTAGAVGIVAPKDVGGHLGIIGTTKEVDQQRGLEIIHEADVFEARPYAPQTYGVTAEDAFIIDPGRGSETKVGQGVPSDVHLGDEGHTLGTVVRITVIAGGIPAIDARCGPVHLVFQQGVDHPARTVEVALVTGDGTVIHVPGKAPGIQHRQFAS